MIETYKDYHVYDSKVITPTFQDNVSDPAPLPWSTNRAPSSI